MVFVVSYLECTGLQTHEAIHFHCLYTVSYGILCFTGCGAYRLASSNLKRIRTYRANNLNRLLE